MRRGENVDDRAALDERRRFRRGAVRFEEAEATGPPRALQVEIGAMRQERIQKRQVLLRDLHRTAAEVGNGLVDDRAHLRLGRKKRADTLNVAIAHGGVKLLDW